jgi:hypothetical protein
MVDVEVEAQVVQQHHTHDRTEGQQGPGEPPPAGAGRRSSGCRAASAGPVLLGRFRRREETGQRRDGTAPAGGTAVGLPGRRRAGRRRDRGQPGLGRGAHGGQHRGQTAAGRGHPTARHGGQPVPDRRGRLVGRVGRGLLDTAGGPPSTDGAALASQQLFDGDRRSGPRAALPAAAGPFGKTTGDARAIRVPRRLFPHRCRHLLVVVPARRCLLPTIRGQRQGTAPDARHRDRRGGWCTQPNSAPRSACVAWPG